MRVVFGRKRSRHKVIFEQGPSDLHFIHVTFSEAPKDNIGSYRHKYSYWILDTQMPRFRELMAKDGLTVESEE